MVTQHILGNSLAKGLVHQLGRDAMAHSEKAVRHLQQSLRAQKESRGSRYREIIGFLKGYSGKGAVKTIESGDRKKRLWESFVVELDETGGFLLTHYWVPFKSPKDFDYEVAPYECHPHGHQRLLQIHAKTEQSILFGIWVAHMATFEKAFIQHGGWHHSDDKTVLTFGKTEVMVWRPSTRTKSGWESISAVSLDALYGPKLKAYTRLKAGYQDERVYSVSEEDRYRYVGRLLGARVDAYQISRLEAFQSSHDQVMAA